MKREILDGQQFGEWTIIEYAGDRKQLCRCSCGAVRAVATSTLKSGKSKNCGDKTQHARNTNSDKAFKDLTGQQFGVLKVINYAGESKWNCVCTICGTPVTLLSKNIRFHKHDTCTHVTPAQLLKQNTPSQPVQPNQSLQKKQSKTAKKHMVGLRFGDYTVIEDKGNDRYICRCICGLEKEIRGYSLRSSVSDPEAYRCRHKIKVGQQFGNFTVIGIDNNQPAGKQYVCKCNCGNIFTAGSYSILNGKINSCGCIKNSKRYSKDEVLEKIKEYINKYGEKPFSKDISTILDLGMTATYEYIRDYELEGLLNKSFGSRAERDIYLFIKSIYPGKIITHDRNILKGNELDIYIPEKSLAIEFNGTYWHSYPRKDKKYHQQKTIACARQGIRLIHIFEYEWDDTGTQNKIKTLLRNVIGQSDAEVLYARKLNVKEITDTTVVKDFENKYHLQGYAVSKINIGLYNDAELVGIMTFGKPRFNSNYECELIRLCYKNKYKVVGGAERMLKYFVNKYKPHSVITYVNISKFTGNVYTKLGFKPTANNMSEPNYIWVDSHNNILTRYQTMKKELLKKNMGTEDMTEDEIMISYNYLKIYDCGNLILEYIGG